MVMFYFYSSFKIILSVIRINVEGASQFLQGSLTLANKISFAFLLML